jgi:ferrous iron transport protein B
MLENKRDKILTMLIIPFMSCSARLPVYILVAGAVFPGNAGNVIFLMYLIGILFSILMAFLLKSTIFKKSEAPFVMELPPYRLPGLRMVLKHMWLKGALYLKKMGGIILIASIVIWALGYFPQNVELSKDFDQLIAKEEIKISDLQSEQLSLNLEEEKKLDSIKIELADLKITKANEQQAASYIGILGRSIEPIMRPLGFDWKMSVSLIAGFAAKEVVVSTMGVLYQVSDSEENTVSLQQKIRDQVYTEGKKKGQKVYTPLSGFSFLIFVLLYLPCISVITVIGRESGSWKWSALVVFYTTFLAWFGSFCVYQIGSLF